MLLRVIIVLATGYMLGNINGAVCISALMHDDVRSHGSGNAGMTNFFRNFGGKKTLIVALTDFLKAALACSVGYLLLQPYGCALEGALAGGLAVSLGHDFPALLGFRGGKGILCGLATAVVADWRVAVVILTVFVVLYAVTKYVSLGSVAASATFGIAFCVFHWNEPVVIALGVIISALALFMHRSNIVRLIKGTESKVYLRRKGNRS